AHGGTHERNGASRRCPPPSPRNRPTDPPTIQEHRHGFPIMAEFRTTTGVQARSPSNNLFRQCTAPIRRKDLASKQRLSRPPLPQEKAVLFSWIDLMLAGSEIRENLVCYQFLELKRALSFYTCSRSSIGLWGYSSGALTIAT